MEWADYMFTDEMSIEVGAVFGKSLVWREKGEKWHDDCVGTKKKNGTSVMCWGAISWGWKGPFFIWPATTKEEKKKAKEEIEEMNRQMAEEIGRLNAAWKSSEEWRNLREQELRVAAEQRAVGRAEGRKVKTVQSFRGKRYTFRPLKVGEGKGVDSWRYVNHLCKLILWPACTERMASLPNFRLMEDNAPSHCSDYTNAAREKVGIPKIEWPANSPDLNPIEHIWRLMKSRILRRRGEEKITTPLQMREVLVEEWAKITIEEINNEVSKLPMIMGRCMLQDGGNKFDA